MLFNSLEFLLFLPIVFGLYWFVVGKSYKKQNVILLIASYVFYGWWDWRFLFLILFSTVVDFLCAKAIERNPGMKKKLFLWYSLATNLGLLAYFKYMNFFINSLKEGFDSLGTSVNLDTLSIILPVGISFYTFQTISYTIDVYRGQLKHTDDFIGFATYVSFFPQLVAGPIERAERFLPQILSNRKFDYQEALAGARLMLWGMFKKVVIADTLASTVDMIFADPERYSGLPLFLGAIFFGVQIYCDFSGYSDIAIGTSRLFGIKLMTNFKFPYFSRNIGEFWRRWHISLSTWFRDYIYIPLGGSKVSGIRALRNVFIVFLISGFWHGANWTFIFWGLLHALLFVPSFVLNRNRNFMNDRFYIERLNLKEIFGWGITFVLVMLAWVPFRAGSIQEAFQYYTLIPTGVTFIFKQETLLVVGFLLADYLVYRQYDFTIRILSLRIVRWSLYFLISFFILDSFGNQESFIYFQF